MNRMNTSARRLLGLFVLLGIGGSLNAADLPEPAHRFEEALVVGSVRTAGRSPTRTDAIEALLVRGNFQAPVEDGTLEIPGGGTRRWRRVEAQDDGWITDRSLRGGYAFASFDAPESTVMLLDAKGHSMVHANGTPRGGDPYRYGSTILPVAIRPGTNDFLFLCARGGVQASLRPLPLDDAGKQMTVFFLERDDTLPDVIRQRPEDLEIGVILVNARETSATTTVRASRNGSTADLGTVDLPALSIRKAALTLPRRLLDAGKDEASITIELTLDDGDTRTITLPVRNETDKHRVTFRSRIDDSVQYYAVVPQASGSDDPVRPGLILSLHGAGVEAQRQASCYSPKEFAILVAPTNRRSFGFDWEDWGRLDALEALAHARERYDTDPRRQWITGHSMGGHGTWQLGTLYPGSFAAVAPSAGWISFWSYAGARDFDNLNAVDQILRHAVSSSNTLAFKDNLAGRGIYVLHGDKDDNVPVDQARTMRKELGDFHSDFVYYEQPGAGHWWGDQCMDWPPLIEFLRARSLPDPATRDSVDFITPAPSVSPELAWVRVEQQQQGMRPSSVHIERDRAARKFTGSTENVASLSLDTTDLEDGDAITIVLDDSELVLNAPPGSRRIRLTRDAEGSWSDAAGIDPNAKNPGRSGPFKGAFRNNMVFVVGTKGTTNETLLLRQKARYDAEQWWYRGNGGVQILEDTEFLASHDWRDGRNVILYGNSENNAAWDSLVDDEVTVDRTGVDIGTSRIDGEDLAVLMVRPIPGDPTGTVAVVSGTGEAGIKLANLMPYWVSGIGYPDCVVIASDMLDGNPNSVRAAGFFGNDWTVESGEFAFSRDLTP